MLSGLNNKKNNEIGNQDDEGLTFLQINDQPVTSDVDPRVAHQDYEAVHKQGNIGIAERLGLRESQEDCVRVGLLNIAHIKGVSRESLERLLRDMASTLQAGITALDCAHAGSTLCANIIYKNLIATLNVGDSTAFICVMNEAGQVITFEPLNPILHNPSTPSEAERIAAAGGVIEEGRIGTVYMEAWLNLSRTIGDNYYEVAGLIHDPDVYFYPVVFPPGGKVFVITACDGLTEAECLTKKDLTKLMEENHHLPVNEIAQLLAKEAIKRGSEDNVSVMVTELNETEEKVKVLAVFDGHSGKEVSNALFQLFNPLLEIKLKCAALKAALEKDELAPSCSRLIEGVKDACRSIYTLFDSFSDESYFDDVIRDEIMLSIQQVYGKYNVLLTNLLQQLPREGVPLDEEKRAEIGRSLLSLLFFSGLINCVSITKDMQKSYFPEDCQAFFAHPKRLVIKLLDTFHAVNAQTVEFAYHDFYAYSCQFELLYRAAESMLAIREKYDSNLSLTWGEADAFSDMSEGEKVIYRIEKAVYDAFATLDDVRPIHELILSLLNRLHEEEEKLPEQKGFLKFFFSNMLKPAIVYACKEVATVYGDAIKGCDLEEAYGYKEIELK